MKRCKTCVHWTRNTRKTESARMGSCNSDKWEYEGTDLTDGVSYADYDGYSASFETGEDFGCIHHTYNAGAVPRRNDVGTSPLLAVSESGDKE